jgi:5-methylcytosine-specific restriction endonuclease McrA
MESLQVLVLSDGYVPLGRISWQEAICDVLSGRAEVLEVYEGHAIHTVSEIFPVPSVIRFIKKVVGFFKRSVKFNRKSVWMRDKETCQYCGHKVTMAEFTYDHVNPLAQGGKTTWTNIVVACQHCNRHKANRTPQEAGMKLLSIPVVPKSINYPGFALADVDHYRWHDYLGG